MELVLHTGKKYQLRLSVFGQEFQLKIAAVKDGHVCIFNLDKFNYKDEAVDDTVM